MGRHLTRWLIPLPAIILAFWPTTVRADTQPGLQYTVWDNYTGQNNAYNANPPLPPTTPIIATGVASRIDYQWLMGPILGTNIYEDVVVKFEGWIDPPTDQMYYLCVASDDGAKMYLDGQNVIDDWYDRGGGCGQTADVDFTDGQPKDMVLWYYENGGYANVKLLYYTDNGWLVAPDSWFSYGSPATTTTTTSSTTSTSTTTTTTTSTSTTTTSSTTTLPPETTTTTEPVQSTTTTSTTSTTTTTTTTSPPAPTTTQAPWTPPQTTTTSEPVVTTTSSTTTTTSLPEPETTTSTTIPETSTTVPETTVPESTVPESTVPDSTVLDTTVPETTVPSLPDETTTTSQPQLPETSSPETVPEEVESSSTTTILEIKADQPISDEKVEQILETLTDAKPEQIVAAIEQVLASNLTSDQAVSIASSSEVLAAITEEQAEQIFEELVVEEITVEQAEELVAVLNEAPTKVKKAFQETINVFAGVFDSFQMVGQTIPVGERRTLVAVSNTLVAVGASLRRKNN